MLAADGFSAVARRGGQDAVPVAAAAEKLRGQQLLARPAVPLAEPAADRLLQRLVQQRELPAQQHPQHVVAAVDARVAGGDEGVVVRQIVQQRLAVCFLPDEAGLFGGEFLGQAVF